MRTTVYTTLATAMMMTLLAGCGSSTTKADTLDGGWATSDGLADSFAATGGTAVSMTASLCAFTTGTYDAALTKLSCYLGSASGEATPIALRIVGVDDGTDMTIPVSAVALPGWHTTSTLSWSASNIRAGTNSYTVWYTMSDGNESNRSTVQLTFGSASATGTVEIATAVVSPNPATVDLSQHQQYYDTSLTFDLYLNSVDPDSPVVAAVITQQSPAAEYRIAVATAPTAAGWMTLTQTFPLPGTGSYTYDVKLVTAAGKESNSVAVTVPVIDSSQNPYGGTALVDNAHFVTNPVLIDFAGGSNSGTSTENIFIMNLPAGVLVKSVWLTNVATQARTQAAVTAQPTFPGWMSVNWTFYATAAGTATYDCVLELSDRTFSNNQRLSISFAQD